MGRFYRKDKAVLVNGGNISFEYEFREKLEGVVLREETTILVYVSNLSNFGVVESDENIMLFVLDKNQEITSEIM